MSVAPTSRCSACPGPHCPIVPPLLPTSTHPLPFLFLGAGPAAREVAALTPYVGLAGDELNGLYLSCAHLHREDVALANATRCWDGSDRTPSESRVLACARHHLPSLLATYKPEVVVLMGGVTQKLSDTRIRLEMHHGRPIRTTLLGGAWEGWVWPSYEPALGMRETGKMTQLMEDFRTLGKWWRGEWEAPVPIERALDYQIVGETRRDWDNLDHYIRCGGINEARTEDDWRWTPAVDTERHGREMWSIQFSVAPGTGRLVRAANRPVLEMVGTWLGNPDVEVTLHNAPQDLDAAERMGVRIPRYRDTMQEAFQACSLPQGLKPLAYRLLGVTMRSWEDVVWPASIDAAIEWMGASYELAEDGLAGEEVTALKRGKCVACGHLHSKGPCKRCECTETRMTFEKRERVTAASAAILKHLLTYTVATRDDDDPYDPWKMMGKMRDGGLRGRVPEKWEWEYLENELGAMPILGIGNCDEHEAKMYAIGDADMTGRVAVELERGRQGERWRVEEADYDE